MHVFHGAFKYRKKLPLMLYFITRITTLPWNIIASEACAAILHKANFHFVLVQLFASVVAGEKMMIKQKAAMRHKYSADTFL